jgi:hypothetical protein
MCQLICPRCFRCACRPPRCRQRYSRLSNGPLRLAGFCIDYAPARAALLDHVQHPSKRSLPRRNRQEPLLDHDIHPAPPQPADSSLAPSPLPSPAHAASQERLPRKVRQDEISAHMNRMDHVSGLTSGLFVRSQGRLPSASRSHARSGEPFSFH